MSQKIIAILGPTASGKTALAVEIAKKFNGEIISADSRQVFRRLDLGTGKDLDEYGSVKYHLIDICDPAEKFTLFQWLTLARRAINDIHSREKLPIIVGGTNLYVRALVEGFEIKNPKSKIENFNSKSKIYSRDNLNKLPSNKLGKILEKLNPEALKTIDQKNPRRLIRAIEIAQEGSAVIKTKPDFEVLQIAIDIEREQLYANIDKRADTRFEQGMLEEVEGLIKSGVNTDWLQGLGLEYKIISSFALGKDKTPEEFEKMKQELKWKSHQYAKRQLSWLRNLTKPIWVKDKNQALKLVKKFLKNK